MPPVEQVLDPPKEPSTKKSVIGIIYPPPEIRNIIDKTGSFVARNGLEFENRIRQNEINNPKFNFLNPNDPYHAYYQYKVKEFKEGKGQEPMAPKPGGGLGLATLQKQQEVVKTVEAVVPKEPPPEAEFIADPPSISAFDLDVVKLTAQFVARNGRGFLTNLMNREQRNYQFDFLRPQHCLFNYFTKLVEQYTKILIPPKDLLPKIRKEADNTKVVLEQVKYRVDWAKFQEREKAKEEEAKEKERVAYAQIDWHDFVVVETVDFQPNEIGNLPPPTTPDEVGARLLAQERFETEDMEEGSDDEDQKDDFESMFHLEQKKGGERKGGVDTTIQDMEEGSDEEDEKEAEAVSNKPPAPISAPPPARKDDKVMSKAQPPLPPPPPPKEMPQPPPLPPTPDQVIIKEYNPKASKVMESEASSKFQVSPLTGETIPADKVDEHVRIGLLDPKWIEQRDRAIQEKRDQEDVYAPGSSIDKTLKKLAERRTDIFGSGVAETQIGKKIGEEEQKKTEKIIWDGHTASMEKVSQKARENISIEDQIAVIHKVKGLVPDEEKEKIGPKAGSGGAPITIPPLPPQPKTSAGMSALPKPPVTKPAMALSTPPQPPKIAVPRPPPIPAPPQPPVVPMGAQPPAGMMVMPPRPPMASGPMVAMQMAPHPSQVMMRMGGPPRPPQPPVPQQAVPRPAPPLKQPAKPSSDEPPAKKAKTEDDLIPEGEFLSKNPEGISVFKVAVPNLPDKPDWKCSGQTVELTLPLTDTVSVIKAKIHEAISMPVGKQKLQYEGLFIKDSNTLAFYNIGKNAVVQLQLKERGGRKK